MFALIFYEREKMEINNFYFNIYILLLWLYGVYHDSVRKAKCIDYVYNWHTGMLHVDQFVKGAKIQNYEPFSARIPFHLLIFFSFNTSSTLVT